MKHADTNNLNMFFTQTLPKIRQEGRYHAIYDEAIGKNQVNT
jgi:hypothetical protein